MLRHQPGGRPGGGGGEHGIDAGICQGGDSPLQPVEVELPGGRLQARPGEIAQARDIEAGGLHQADIVFPAGFGPLLRVVGRAEVKFGGWCVGGFDVHTLGFLTMD